MEVMDSGPRHVLVHGHIFKNAGSTFDWALRKCFGEAFLDHRDATQMRKGAEYLGPFLESNPEILALSTHHLQLPLPVSNQYEIIPAFLIRHPIERIGSVYEFEHHQRADTPGARMAKQLNFNDYIRWRMEQKVGATIREFHTRYCCSIRPNPTLQVSEAHFEEARVLLSHEAIVGVVDRYDESMVCAENRLAALWPDLDLSYVRQNVTNHRPQTLPERIDQVISRMDPDVIELTQAQNRFDMRLYDLANRLLDAVCEGIADFDARLQEFRGRCRKLMSCPNVGALDGVDPIVGLGA